MQSLEILKQELITQKDLLDSKGFPVNVKNINPSPSEITEAIQNIDIDFTKSDAVESDVVLGKSFFSKDSSLKVGTLVLPDFESATATENTVMAGKTFYAGDNVLKTGTAEITDLSQTTATADTVMEGKEFYNASGEKVAGTYKDMLQWKCDENKDLSSAFKGAQIENLSRLENLDTSNVTNMGYMFDGNKLVKIAPQLDTSNVTDMQYMFNSCNSLTTIPLYNTSKVTNMQYMLSGTSLTEVPQFDTGKVTNMNSMLSYCRGLTTIPQFDTSNVTNMYAMFFNCTSLTEVPQLNTSKVTNMQEMFSNCTSLTEVPQLNSISVTNFQSIFYHCTNLTTVPLLDMRKANQYYIANMFDSCANLTNLTIKNIPSTINLKIGDGTKWGHLLTLDSLLNTIKELWTNTSTSTRTLTVGSANLEKLADVYVKLVDITDDMRAEDEYIDNKAPFVQCESTDEGAMLITEYVTTIKNWQLA